MLTFTLLTPEGEKQCTVPAGWQQVTVERHAAQYGKSGLPRVAALLGIEPELLEQVPDYYVEVLFGGLDFLQTDIPELMPGTIAAVKVANKSIGQLEKCRELLSKFSPFEAAPYVVAIYATEPYNETEAWQLAEQYKQQPIESIYASFVFLLEQINAFYNFYGPAFDNEPDENEKAAGIDRFKEYGFFATLYNVAKGDLTKLEELRQVPAGVFYTALCLEQDKADYQKQLQELNNVTNQEA